MKNKYNLGTDAMEIRLQLLELASAPSARNILCISRDGSLVSFNQCNFYDISNWSDDDIEEVENASKTLRIKTANKIDKGTTDE